MTYQIQEKAQKAEDDKSEYRQKLDEMHEKILKSNQQADEVMKSLEQRAREAEDKQRAAQHTISN